MDAPFIFPLSRYIRFMVRQEYELLILESEHLSLKKGDKVIHHIPLVELELFVFRQSKNLLPEMFQVMALNSWVRSEPQVELKWGEHEFLLSLELDARYRQNEILEMLIFLYEKGVQVREYSALNKLLFLQEPVTAEDLKKKIKGLGE